MKIELTKEQIEQIEQIKPKTDGPIKIVILQRGWVFVGRYSKTGIDCVLENAKCIRQWGTTKGLGELVAGPLSKTVLDDASTVRFHELGVIATIDCDQEGWAKVC